MSLEVRPARTAEEVEAALALRRAVFVDEQGVPVDEEVDEHDRTAMHVLALRDGELAGTMRLVDEGDALRLGRLAVAGPARGRGVAAALLDEADRVARERGVRRIVLSAQTRALGLYERAGYVARGSAFLDAGIEHVAMERSLA